jgi:hypothetical protein
MRKDRRNRAHIPQRLRPPNGRLQMLDKNLVHPLISRKHPNRRPIKLSSRSNPG